MVRLAICLLIDPTSFSFFQWLRTVLHLAKLMSSRPQMVAKVCELREKGSKAAPEGKSCALVLV